MNDKIKSLFLRVLWITIGTLIAAFSLECVLIPNDVIDGGVVGISIMVSYLTGCALGIPLIIINLPFIFMALQKFGKTFVLLMFYGVFALSFFSEMFLKMKYVFTEDTLLAAIFGGMILGVGVGIVLKCNSSLDGTEILAMKLTKIYPFSVGEIIMFFNVFIFIVAGFVYAPEKAMYSAIAYFIAYRLIDIVIQGLNEAKSIFIISSKFEEIGKAVMKELDKSVTYLNAEGGYSGVKTKMIYCVITKIEIQKIREIVNLYDKEAFIAVENVHEVEGKRLKK